MGRILPAVVGGRMPHQLFLLVIALFSLLTTSQAQPAAPTLVSLQSSIATPFSPADVTPTTFTYEQHVPYATHQINFTAIVNGSADLYGSWEGGPQFRMTSGVSSPILNLNLDASFNEFILTIVADPSIGNTTYTIDVLRPTIVGVNANLLGFSFQPTVDQNSHGITDIVESMDPANFSSQVTSYTMSLNQGIEEFAFVPMIDTTASITLTTSLIEPLSANVTLYDAVALTNNQLSPTISMAGISVLKFALNITAEDGVTKKAYLWRVQSYDFTHPTVSSSTGSTQIISSSSTSTPPLTSSSSSTGSNSSIHDFPSSTGGPISSGHERAPFAAFEMGIIVIAAWVTLMALEYAIV